jgi:predicted nuclease with TOPRIM domain
MSEAYKLKERSKKLWEEVQVLSKQWDEMHKENQKRLVEIKKNLAETRKTIERIQASNKPKEMKT